MQNKLNLNLSNFRSFPPETDLDLTNLNLFVGANNTGKSNLSKFFKMLDSFYNNKMNFNCSEFFNSNHENEIIISLPIHENKNYVISGKWRFKPVEYNSISNRKKVELFNHEYEFCLNGRSILTWSDKSYLFNIEGLKELIHLLTVDNEEDFRENAFYSLFHIDNSDCHTFIKNYKEEIINLLCELPDKFDIQLEFVPINLIDRVSISTLFERIEEKFQIREKIHPDNKEFVWLIFKLIIDLIVNSNNYLKYVTRKTCKIDFENANFDTIIEEYDDVDFNNIKSFIMSHISSIKDMSIKGENAFNMEQLRFLKNNKWHKLDEFGSGFKRNIIFLINLKIQIELSVFMLINYAELLEIVFIEEPENYLHPDLQIEFANIIIYLLKDNPRVKRFVIETHSPIIIRAIQHATLTGKIKTGEIGIFDFAQLENGDTIINNVRINSDGLLSSPFMTGFDTKVTEIDFELWEIRNKHNNQN
jgi:predicted ATP-dependent endonuclease of OLD family